MSSGDREGLFAGSGHQPDAPETVGLDDISLLSAAVLATGGCGCGAQAAAPPHGRLAE